MAQLCVFARRRQVNFLSECRKCNENKLNFLKPKLPSAVVRANRPFERLYINLVVPKISAYRTGNRLAFTTTDDYSLILYAFCIERMTSTETTSCPRNLFSVFGTQSFFHSERKVGFSTRGLILCMNEGLVHSSNSSFSTR